MNLALLRGPVVHYERAAPDRWHMPQMITAASVAVAAERAGTVRTLPDSRSTWSWALLKPEAVVGSQGWQGRGGSRPAPRDPRPRTKSATRDPRPLAIRAARLGPDICQMTGPARIFVKIWILNYSFIAI